MFKYNQEEVVNMNNFLRNDFKKVLYIQIQIKTHKLETDIDDQIKSLERQNEILLQNKQDLEKFTRHSLKALDNLKRSTWNFTIESYSEL